jgi:hypothetical protein
MSHRLLTLHGERCKVSFTIKNKKLVEKWNTKASIIQLDIKKTKK